jgi:hypothetical protein
MEIARTFKRVLEMAKSFIVQKLDFVPEFFLILELT